MKLLITGANGYIGERLVQRAGSLGHEVVAASRGRPAGVPQLAWLPFDLTAKTDICLPQGVNTVFHLAAATTLNTIDPAVEIDSASRLINAAQQVGAKFIFVSSQTARQDAPTAYGRTKWQIERLVLAAGGWVIRPGQVYGGVERGLFGVLVGAVRKLPFIPALLPSPKIQPVHVDDLVLALLRCAEPLAIPPSVLCVGSITPVSFTCFLRRMAITRVRRFRPPMPVPVFLVRLVGLMLGARLRLKFGFTRLTSLLDLPLMETEGDMQRLGISLRPLSSGMARSGDDRRRHLIREGVALLTYVLREKPTPAVIRRYVRCIEKIRGGQPLMLPECMLRFPSVVSLLDASGPARAEFGWRLNAAVSFAEASVQGARRFLGIGEANGFFRSLVSMSYAVALELWWRVLRVLFTPILPSLLRGSRLS
jgi:nucleoside-diphosphate-sugar epimerase